MVLRSDVVEAAGVRSSERRRAWADSSKRASEPDAEPPPRARWSTHYSPRAHVSLTRRLRRAVAVWPEEPGLTPAPTLLRRRLHAPHRGGHTQPRAAAAAAAAAARAARARAAWSDDARSDDSGDEDGAGASWGGPYESLVSSEDERRAGRARGRGNRGRADAATRGRPSRGCSRCACAASPTAARGRWTDTPRRA
jgi:hypothetical protein